MRRGILYDTAERLGCNKIALGHHRDDTLETVMMNMFFSGKLQAMPAVYTTDDQRFQVIRPLIECAESDIEEYARQSAFPILPCNLCGSQAGLQRERMGDLLTQLEKDIPMFVRCLAALKNVRPTHHRHDRLINTESRTGLRTGSRRVRYGVSVEFASHYNYGLKPGQPEVIPVAN